MADQPKNAMLRRPFNPRGSDYDYKSAMAAGMGPAASGPNKGHWSSVTRVDPQTAAAKGLPEESYLLLKGRDHDTWNLAELYEGFRNFKVIQHEDGRYYSVPFWYSKNALVGGK